MALEMKNSRKAKNKESRLDKKSTGWWCPDENNNRLRAAAGTVIAQAQLSLPQKSYRSLIVQTKPCPRCLPFAFLFLLVYRY